MPLKAVFQQAAAEHLPDAAAFDAFLGKQDILCLHCLLDRLFAEGQQPQQLEHRCGHSLLRKGLCCLHRLRAQLAVGDQQQPRLCSLWFDCPRHLRVEGGQLALSSARIAHTAYAGVLIQAFVQRAAHLLIGSRRVQGDARHAGKHGDIE